MADVLRSCAKTGCRWPAAASLSYRYATRQVWLLDLAAAPDPSLYDLCPHHADHLVVPKGWEHVDDRSVQEIMVEPSAFDRAEEAARRRMTAVEPPPRHVAVARPQQLVGASAGAPGRNRYAALVEQLPKLAAEQQAHPLEEEPRAPAPTPQTGAASAATGHAVAAPAAEPAAEPDAPPAPAAIPDAAAAPPPPPPGPLADRGRSGPTTGAGRPPVLPVRDLAPSAADDTAPPPPPADPPAPTHGDQALPGQLSIPVEDLGETSGVVLQFDLAGARRRGKSS